MERVRFAERWRMAWTFWRGQCPKCAKPVIVLYYDPTTGKYLCDECTGHWKRNPRTGNVHWEDRR